MSDAIDILAERQAVPPPPTRTSRLFGFLRQNQGRIFAWGAALVFLAAGWGIYQFLGTISFSDILEALRAIPTSRLLVALACTVGSYIALLGYDVSALAYIGRRLPPLTVAVGSFCGYAIGNTVGFGVLTGGSVRYRVYAAEGLSGTEIGRVALFVAGAFTFGISVVSCLPLMLQPNLLAEFFNIRPLLVEAIGLLGTAFTVVLIALCFLRRRVAGGRLADIIPSGPLVLVQLVISVVDILMAAGVLFVMLPHSDVQFFEFLPVFTIALVAGVISHVPAGLGIFEAVVVFALRDKVAPEPLIASLVAFRAVYYVLPLLAAAVLLALLEVTRKRRAVSTPGLRSLTVIGSRSVPLACGTLAFGTGAVLLASGATPGIEARLSVLEGLIPLSLLEASHLLASLAGVALLVLARGLYRRLNAAWWLTVTAALPLAIVFTLLKGGALEEAALLALVLAILVPCRDEFYRRTSLLNQPFTGSWLIALAAVMAAVVGLMFFAFKEVEYADQLWWEFAFASDAPRALRAVLLAAIAVGVVAMLHLLRAPKAEKLALAPGDMERARAIIAAQDRPDATMALIGDKLLLFSESGRAFLMFGKRGSSWVALYDPIGPEEEHRDLVWRFRELCDREGVRPAFYQVTADLLPLYVDLGLEINKLGEEAKVDLGLFDIDGKGRKDLRYTMRRGERDGLAFAIEPDAAALMGELQTVSDTWLTLKSTREKGFSMGHFRPDFIGNFRIATVRLHGKLIAFANILETATRRSASVDLMRHGKEAPPSTMEFLFVKLLLALKAEGYGEFSLGMAPLAGLEPRRLATLFQRLGATIFRHGETLYNFRGLRAFKEKFDPDWEPRFLAAPGGIWSAVTLADIAALIGGGVSGVVRK